MSVLLQVTGGVGGGGCPLGMPVRVASVSLDGNSQLALGHRRALVRVSRATAACSESIGGGGAQGCTTGGGLCSKRRRRNGCRSERGVAAAGGARTSGRARSETAERGSGVREGEPSSGGAGQ